MTKSLDVSYEKALQAVQAAEAGKVDVEARGACQACLTTFVAKPSAASRGKMVLVKHGYERPGYGYLVGQCPGTAHQPFELSCEYTKVWRKELVEVYLPQQRQRLAKLKSGEEKRLVGRVYDRKIYKYIDVQLVEGQALPEDWTSRTTEIPNFAYLRKSAINNTEAVIESLIKDIAWLDERIAGWRYAPELLLPKTKGKTEGQTMRQWLDGSRVELEKLPSPTGWKWSGGSFWDWARKFPTTLMYTTMGGLRSPTYYKTVRKEYETITGAKPLSIERPEREATVVSRERAEQLAERAKKQAALQAKRSEKAQRDASRSAKAYADCEALRTAFKTVFDHEGVVAKMKAQKSWYYGKDMSLFEVYTSRLNNEKALAYVEGTENIADVLAARKKNLSWTGTPDSLRSHLRDIYKDLRKDVAYFGLKLKAM